MALTRAFIFRLDWYDKLSRQSLSKAHREPLKRVARGVLGVLVGALCISVCSASPAGVAMPLPTLTPERYAQFLVGDKQAECLFNIAKKESNIRFDAINRQSGAVGAWQFMNPRLKDKTPLQQVELAIKYSFHRYGTPCDSWRFWKRNYWW